MKRVALFLKEKQIKKLKALARKEGNPWARIVRRAVDFYFTALKSGGLKDDELSPPDDNRE